MSDGGNALSYFAKELIRNAKVISCRLLQAASIHVDKIKKGFLIIQCVMQSSKLTVQRKRNFFDEDDLFVSLGIIPVRLISQSIRWDASI